jgi:hypothetical protein
LQIKVYSFNSHRLALHLNQTGKLLPLIQEALMDRLDLSSDSKKVRISNLL